MNNIERIDANNGEVFIDGNTIEIPPMQMAFLVKLVQHSPNFVRTEILDAMVGENGAKVYAKRLRYAGIPIDSRRGYGYRVFVNKEVKDQVAS